jgi:hypothetical protein
VTPANPLLRSFRYLLTITRIVWKKRGAASESESDKPPPAKQAKQASLKDLWS